MSLDESLVWTARRWSISRNGAGMVEPGSSRMLRPAQPTRRNHNARFRGGRPAGSGRPAAIDPRPCRHNFERPAASSSPMPDVPAPNVRFPQPGHASPYAQDAFDSHNLHPPFSREVTMRMPLRLGALAQLTLF